VSCCGQLGAFTVWWSVLLCTGKQQNRGEVQSMNSALSSVGSTAFGTHFTAFKETIIVIANEISDVLP
jgi:hypothetical protein